MPRSVQTSAGLISLHQIRIYVWNGRFSMVHDSSTVELGRRNGIVFFTDQLTGQVEKVSRILPAENLQYKPQSVESPHILDSDHHLTQIAAFATSSLPSSFFAICGDLSISSVAMDLSGHSTSHTRFSASEPTNSFSVLLVSDQRLTRRSLRLSPR